MLPRIKIKRALALLAVVLLCSASFILYLNKYLNVFLNMKQNGWGDRVKPIKEIIYDKDVCSFRVDYVPTTDIQMLNMYEELPFDDVDGGVWKQGWKIEVDPLQWNKEHKLKVFVVPHSHNDPGWIRTFLDYFQYQTKHILQNMLVKLQEDPRRKFIWAEISFFSLWWDDLNQEEKDIVKRLVHNNQLEIVTGGWVMNDEANSHWISLLHQLTEGHQWLHKHLNYTPKSHWSIDPFGLSATQPMLLKRMGLDNGLIQRVHYAVKKQLARTTNLEFKWKQTWDENGGTELLTQVMPFYGYDIPHTCGPDPKICCQFDFKRLPGHGVECPWKVEPQPITDANVAHKAEMLLDQYRKKSTLYKTNVLFIPLGDDFRFTHSVEWDVQYQNYQKLFDYMNSNRKLHVQIQFGTLTDYFNALRAEIFFDKFPTLSGDFFTYSDRNDHYWSGYYTSRPFYKRMERVLLSYVRAAEIILSLAHLSNKPGSNWIANDDIGLGKNLTYARRALSLFQHHDGITGTAKDHVVVDYGKKMLNSIRATQHVIQLCTNLLVEGPNAEVLDGDIVHYSIDDIRHSHKAEAEKHTITIGLELNTKIVAIFNSLPFRRKEVVTFIVSTSFVEVLDEDDARIRCQVSPIFEYSSVMSISKYQLSFIANIPALGIVFYTIRATEEHLVQSETSYASIQVFNQPEDVNPPPGFKNVVSSSTGNDFNLHNSYFSAAFNSMGLLKAIKIDKQTTPVHLDFIQYGVTHKKDKSGAYLFLPDGEATLVNIENAVVNVIEGPILSSVLVQLPYIQHKVSIFNTSGADGLGLEIQNLVDISKTSNFEIAMRLSTNINNENQFFTDLNGYQMLRRRRFDKLPLQANYYPIPAMAHIEDKTLRLSILTGSPLGCSSLKNGQLEIMLDRRLNQDDSLGLGQGVLDNHPTRHVFRVILERRKDACESTSANHPAGFPTLAAHVASQSLLNPPIHMLKSDEDGLMGVSSYSPVSDEFGADFTLPSLRTGVLINGQNHVGIVLHRQHLDVCFANNTLFQQFPLSSGYVSLEEFLPKFAGPTTLHMSSLSYLSRQQEIPFNDYINLCPMEMQAFVLRR